MDHRPRSLCVHSTRLPLQYHHLSKAMQSTFTISTGLSRHIRSYHHNIRYPSNRLRSQYPVGKVFPHHPVLSLPLSLSIFVPRCLESVNHFLPHTARGPRTSLFDITTVWRLKGFRGFLEIGV